MRYILVCRECEPVLPMPFESAEDRGRWAGEHTSGTGHGLWLVLDGDYSLEQTFEELKRLEETSKRVRAFFDSL